MKQRINTAAVEGVSIADDLVQAVDINETMTTPEASYDIFKQAVNEQDVHPEPCRHRPSACSRASRMRALVNTHMPDPQLVTKVTAALSANVKAPATQAPCCSMSASTACPRLQAGKVVSRERAQASPKSRRCVFPTASGC
jgi:zinc protease